MLEQLIAILASGELATTQDLASRLSVSVELVEQMLLDLERGGYLAPVTGECDRHCTGCAQASSCAIMGSRRVWRVTDKGRRLAGATSS